MSSDEVNETMRRVREMSQQRGVELQLTIKRLLAGDTAELVRHVVEFVTDAMMDVLNASPAIDPENEAHADLICALIDAKWKAYKEITGRDFETISNRVLHLRREMRGEEP